MKLMHTSDWHLGMELRGGQSYHDDQRHFIDQICRIAVEADAGGILIAGDVFDRQLASRDALKLYDETMTHICGDLRIPVFLIAGNHDGAERISQCSELLKASGLHIAGSLTGEVRPVRLGDVDVYMCPWISTDKVKTIYPERADEIGTMEDAYRVVMDAYRERFEPGRKNVLVAHAYIVDAETSVSDRAAEIGKATMVSADVFEGFDYVALGHLHGPQDVGEHVRYSGTPMAYSFGREESQVKSVTIIDTDDMSREIVPIPQLHRRVTLTGTYEELLGADYDESILQGYVRLEVTDRFVGLEGAAALRERYDHMLEYSCRTLERDDARITMTMEEFEDVEDDPLELFKRYCQDVMESEPDGHLEELFMDAVRKYESEVTES